MKENRSKIKDLQSVINILKIYPNFLFLMKIISSYEAKKEGTQIWLLLFYE